MPQIFHRSANTLSKVSLAGILLLVGGLIGLAMLLGRSSYVTRAQEYVEQPVQFSHLHHVLDDGIDCRYCHTSVETSSFAGIPPTKTCMNCHSQIWQSAPILEPVRASFREDKPMTWIRVHDLPDFVYFNHSIHVKKGMGCETCHGRIDQMPLTKQQNSLQMEWCLNCHRNPQDFVRPREEVFTMGYRPPEDPGDARGSRSSWTITRSSPAPTARRVIGDPLMSTDIQALRAKLQGTRGREYWRSLEAVAETPEFKEYPASRVPAKRLGVARSGRPAWFPQVDGRVARPGGRDGVHAAAGRGDRSVRPSARGAGARQAALLRDGDAVCRVGRRTPRRESRGTAHEDRRQSRPPVESGCH